MRAFTIDFEATDIDPKKAKPVEVAYYDGQNLFETLIHADTIPVETSAVHHITNVDVANAPTWEQVKRDLQGKFLTEPLTVLVAHNAKYERDVLGDFGPVLWVCTYKCALRIWPDAPAHKNEVLRYFLGLGDNLGRGYPQFAHSAGHDARVTWLLFQKLLEHATLEQLIEWTEQPAKFPRIMFGKHRGKRWDEIDNGYLNWMLAQSDMDPDVKYCAKEELDRRRASSGHR